MQSKYTDYNDTAWEMTQARLAWKVAAMEAMNFIKENVRIVGFDEIEAFKKVKELIDDATRIDKKRLSQNPYSRQFNGD